MDSMVGSGSGFFFTLVTNGSSVQAYPPITSQLMRGPKYRILPKTSLFSKCREGSVNEMGVPEGKGMARCQIESSAGMDEGTNCGIQIPSNVYGPVK